jgi:hypothetical protein
MTTAFATPLGAQIDICGKKLYIKASNLDKEKYDVTILCSEKESKISDKTIPYYKDKHIELKTRLVFIDSFLITYKPIRRITSKINKVLFKI